MTIDSPSGRILVLGASGRIGRLLRAQWDPEGHRHLWQRRIATAEAGGATAQAGEATAQAGWRVFDPLADPAALGAAAREVEQILCLAGPLPGRSDQDLRLHGDLACAAVAAAAEVGAVRVVLASSAAVYGADPAAREDQPLTPANAYGAAKAEMELRAQGAGAALDVPVTALRIGNVAGFDAALGGWRAGFTLDHFASGHTPRRSYIGLRALADVLAALLARPDLPAAVNIAQPGLVAMGDLLRAAGRDYAKKTAPPEAIEAVGLDLSRLSGLLGEQSLPVADPVEMVADFAALEPILKDQS